MGSAYTRDRRDEQPREAATRQEIVDMVWAEFHDLILGRLDVIEAALRALAAGRLGEPERARAEQAAHSACGSLAMFGSGDGSRLARRALRLVERPNAGVDLRAAHLADRVHDLRSKLAHRHH